MINQIQPPKQAAKLFADWPETPIYSCFSGTMGQIFGDDQSALALIGDFGFLAGKPDQALAQFKPAASKKTALFLVPQTAAWGWAIEAAWGSSAQRFTRYATKKDTHFDREALKQLIKLPADLHPEKMSAQLFQQCKEQAWSEDFTAQFTDYNQFARLAAGVLVLSGDTIVAGASAYTAYPGGIEIEVDTREDFRRQGLATAASAQLILDCLDRGLYPSWDAHTKVSLALAEKLGYELANPYPAYLVRPWQ